ncbi:polysaccharide biosynthesis tyrosine autokinase [Streptomyces sp. NP160]|uniref:polysaccharide biosynthesis tyrosine autokinase n=1 Tax=Streptomyces sp. NP160 TaxID=2586637 RepID=UPI00111A2B33|nr:polysaccharide biosynthesis tyrosine autokinase [Streptomyces sp. NP160]TNM61045.1 polysaccharide biosynthesis tyrosine autokinase [Streptomyces sp. NP160]
MTLHEFLVMLRRRWVLVVVVMVVFGGVAGVRSALTEPVYQASAQSFVTTSAGQQTGTAFQGSQFTLQRVASYVSVATSSEVLGPVAAARGGGESVGSLQRRVTASSPEGTVLVNITATGPTGAAAAELANQVAREFAVVVEDLERPAPSEASTVKVTVIEPATAPTRPISPRLSTDLAVGLLLGAFVGLGLAIARHQLDSTVHGAQELQEFLGTSPLGVVTADRRAAESVTAVEPGQLWAEAYRSVRDNLRFVDVDAPPRTVVVTSATPSEGKSTTACNLAIALAQAGQRVVLVDADLRRPAIATYLGLEGGAGLTDVLSGAAALEDLLQPSVTPSLSVLAAGRTPPDPATLLGSHQMEVLLAKLAAENDVVVIDAPPVLPVADAGILANAADGALLVVRHDRAKRQQVQAAVERLTASQGRLLGTVLTFVPRRSLSAGYGYGYGYGHEERSGGRRRLRALGRRRAPARTRS